MKLQVAHDIGIIVTDLSVDDGQADPEWYYDQKVNAPVAGRDTEDFVPGAIREHRAHPMPQLWTSSPQDCEKTLSCV